MKKAVILHDKKTKPIWYGHPWIFPKAIAGLEGDPQAGECLQIFDSKRQCIGIGVWNPHSLYRVRVLAYAEESLFTRDLVGLIEQRLKQAQQLRCLLGLPNAATTAYRLCNSEGDGLSGLTIDLYADIAVVASSAYWVELQRDVIEGLLLKMFAISQVIWRPQVKALQQDGWRSAQASPLIADLQRRVSEAGVDYDIHFQQMQKTGLFLDQRENHQRIAALCHKKRVLDLYCYTGGFALHAAKAGASHVAALDSSQDAIHAAQRNAALNGLTVDFRCADVVEHLSEAAQYDIVILDPPKLVPTRQHLPQATRHYRHLHEQIFRALPQNGLLLTCNCSAAMSWDLFLNMLSEAAARAKRSIQCLEKMGAARDHPTRPAFPEGEYLRAVLLRVL